MLNLPSISILVLILGLTISTDYPCRGAAQITSIHRLREAFRRGAKKQLKNIDKGRTLADYGAEIRYAGKPIWMNKRTQAQIELFCVDCKARQCDEQGLQCVFRLRTKPNWIQKRQIANDNKREAKRAKETGRTAYFRTYKREYLIRQILAEQ